MNNLESKIFSRKEELRRKIPGITQWIETLSNSLRNKIEGNFRSILGPLEILHAVPDYLEYIVPVLAKDKKENNQVMSLLYAYVNLFLRGEVIPKISRNDFFRPSLLGKSIAILEDTKSMVEKLYNEYYHTISPKTKDAFSGLGIVKMATVYPVETSVNETVPFFEKYREIKRAEYLAVFKKIYSRLENHTRFNHLSGEEKAKMIMKNSALVYDLDFAKKSILPEIGKSEEEIETKLDFFFRS
jgi:hypothetical protein